MRGRIIGSIWILTALAICYFCFEGRLMGWLIGASLLMAIAEIAVVTDFQSWRMVPDACPPPFAWVLQFVVLSLAFMACFVLKPMEFALIIIATVLSDSGAFTVGKLIGRHHIEAVRAISPNKTLEGFIGGAILPALTSAVLPLIGYPEITLKIAIFVCLSGIVAECGDLLGSATKRQLGIKDSGQVLSTCGLALYALEYPVRGHGGYLDRTDSLSLNIVLFMVIQIVASFF